MTARQRLLLLSLALTGCDGRQYVSPDTVGLVITNDETGVTRVDRCNYIPVLLGSRIQWRYTIDFATDGTFAARADCNQVAGAYELSGDDGITITPGPSTLMAICQCSTSSRARSLAATRRRIAPNARGSNHLITTRLDGTQARIRAPDFR